MMKRILWALVASAMVVMAGCDAKGNTGPDASAGDLAALEAQVTALSGTVTALQAQVTASEASRPAVFLRSASTTSGSARSASGLRANAEEPAPEGPCSNIGTLTGRPTNGDPILTTRIAGVSCMGFLFVLDDSGATADVAEPPPSAVFFETADCTGQPYMSPNNGGATISPAAYNQGAVFRVNGEYVYLPPATSAVMATVNIGSRVDNGVCVPFGSVPVDFSIALLPNDVMVTGVASAPIAGPIVVGAAP